MRILWLCNMIPPAVAANLGMKASDKEGWVLGAMNALSGEAEYELAVAFPVPRAHDGYQGSDGKVRFFGFYEDTGRPEDYDPVLPYRLKSIVDEFEPEVVHVFGTEYPHTLAMCEVYRDDPGRVLIGLQGIMNVYKDHYFDGLPGKVVDRVTFRDLVKQDSLKRQKKKYDLRALNEVKALKLAANVTGRTPFDKEAALAVNPGLKYHFMNETLRSGFYELPSEKPIKEPYSIFISQGNYPIKGAHYMLEALALLKKEFPSARLIVAGDNITKHGTVKEKIKLSSYGKYLLELIDRYNLRECVVFTGSLNAAAFRERMLRSTVYVCPSAIENSPNSLGEAMLLKVPCVAARVGGIPGIFDDGRDGILYEPGNVPALAEAVASVWRDPDKAAEYTDHAREHALMTHDPLANLNRLKEIYKTIKER